MSSLESFRGDFEELSALMRASWAENAQEPLLYTASFLRNSLTQPGASLDLCPALYEDGRLVAFGAGFPRDIVFDGAPLRLLLDSFITVSPTHKGRGLGGVIWNGIAEAGKRARLDGLITFCVEGDLMNQSLPKFSERYALPTLRALSIPYLARPVPKLATVEKRWADPHTLRHAAATLTAPLRRQFTEAAAQWQCRDRERAFGATLDSATISAYAMHTAGATPTLCGLIDDVLWGDLGGDLHATARAELVQALLASAAASEVDLLLLPVLNYADLAPFAKAGFRRIRRVLHMYLSAFSERFTPRPLDAAYIDAF